MKCSLESATALITLLACTVQFAEQYCYSSPLGPQCFFIGSTLALPPDSASSPFAAKGVTSPERAGVSGGEDPMELGWGGRRGGCLTSLLAVLGSISLRLSESQVPNFESHKGRNCVYIVKYLIANAHSGQIGSTPTVQMLAGY